MKRRFAIPATIAFTLHAMLFLGSTRPPPPPPDATTSAVPTDEPKPDDKTVFEVDLRPEAPAEETDPRDVAGGDLIEAPPRGPDIPPPRDPRAGSPVFEQTVVTLPSGHGPMPASWKPGIPRGPGDGALRTLRVSDLDEAPRTRFRKAPSYPSAMRSLGMGGTVWVEFLVDERGRVSALRVIKASNTAFEAATLAAVSEWRFEPGKRHGLPVRFRMSLPVVFSLGD